MENQVKGFSAFTQETNESRRHGTDHSVQAKIENGLLALINSAGPDEMMSEEEFMRTVNRIAKDYYGHVAYMREF